MSLAFSIRSSKRRNEYHQQSRRLASFSIMFASSSSSLLAPRQWRYDVFPSFSGQDVRRNFLSHLLGEFKRKGINTFVDGQVRRSESIGPELVRAIRASRIGLVILTKNYASSRWCLDELLEIMESSQNVMPIFYDINPSDVRKQTGDFGKAFKRTCEGKTEEQKQRWQQALTSVANRLGEHSDNWDSEAAMILKISTDITNMLGCGVQLLEPCSCEYNSIAHPKLSTILVEEDESNNNMKAIKESGLVLQRG